MKEKPPILVKLSSQYVFDLANGTGYSVAIHPVTKKVTFTKKFVTSTKMINGKEVIFLDSINKKVPLGVLRKSMVLLKNRKEIICQFNRS